MEETEDEYTRQEAHSWVTPVRQKFTIGFLVWMISFSLVLVPFLSLGMGLTWFLVMTAPMAKITWKLMQICWSKPLHVRVQSNYSKLSRHHHVLVVFRAVSRKYLTYSLFGINIFFINCIPIVLFRAITLIVGLITGHHFLPPLVSFTYDILCVVPITFFIGTSIENITAQTNYMVGALLNASFGSLTELLLFTLALNKGNLNDLIIYSLTGGLLNDMLLIPGLSMIGGGFRFKEQVFNPSATGVGALLFFMAITGAFAPTIFYQAFGGYSEVCRNCSLVDEEGDVCFMGERDCFWDCHLCFARQDPQTDPRFLAGVQNLMYLAAILLPISYMIGLFFTFRTHSHLFEEDSEESEEEQAEWSVATSAAVMVTAMMIFGIIAEDVVEIVEVVLHHLGIKQSFLGVTLIALTPAFTEIVNAVRFALDNRIGLAVQIGAASAVQVALVQMPALVLISVFFAKEEFYLIFPNLSIFSVTLAAITFNYIQSDGRTNYFIGAVLVVMYILLIAAFYYIPGSQDTPWVP